MAEVVATYSIEILSERTLPGFVHPDVTPVPARITLRQSYLRELEENISSLLPAGFEVRVQECDTKGNT